jgi:L-threonylcarbamoyladenylate synthase
MEILTKAELSLRFDEISQKVTEGVLFIYPTDTIYGLGCKATDEVAVEKLRKLKERDKAPFSIWVPSLSWVKENCVMSKELEKWLRELPGPYTLIVKLKNKKAIAQNVAPNINTVGVRYPDHWFQKAVKKFGFPIITTSANKTGKPFMTGIENLDSEIEKTVEFIIYEGPKEGRPSKIVDVEKAEIQDR